MVWKKNQLGMSHTKIFFHGRSEIVQYQCLKLELEPTIRNFAHEFIDICFYKHNLFVPNASFH